MRSLNFLRVACFAALAGAFAGFGPPVAAEVTRCTDAAGKVSYTDKACPSNTRRSEQLEIDTNGTTYPAAPAPAPARAPASEVVAQPPVDGGLIVIDPRARDLAESRLQERERQRREAAERDAAGAYPYPYPYSGYPNAQHRRAARPQDLRPTLRNCDAGGCNDTMGNHYDRAGKVDRYVRPDGRTCRPVGTTVIC